MIFSASTMKRCYSHRRGRSHYQLTHSRPWLGIMAQILAQMPDLDCGPDPCLAHRATATESHCTLVLARQGTTRPATRPDQLAGNDQTGDWGVAPSPTAPPQRTTGLGGTVDPRPSFTARNRREAFGDRTAAAAWPVSPLRPPATAISVHAAPAARRRSCRTTIPSTFGTRGRRHRGPRRWQQREGRPRDVKSGGG
jgi:hypothetical protein